MLNLDFLTKAFVASFSEQMYANRVDSQDVQEFGLIPVRGWLALVHHAFARKLGHMEWKKVQSSLVLGRQWDAPMPLMSFLFRRKIRHVGEVRRSFWPLQDLTFDVCIIQIYFYMYFFNFLIILVHSYISSFEACPRTNLLWSAPKYNCRIPIIFQVRVRVYIYKACKILKFL